MTINSKTMALTRLLDNLAKDHSKDVFETLIVKYHPFERVVD